MSDALRSYPVELHDFAVAVGVRRSWLLNPTNSNLPGYTEREAELWRNVCREGHKAAAALRVGAEVTRA